MIAAHRIPENRGPSSYTSIQRPGWVQVHTYWEILYLCWVIPNPCGCLPGRRQKKERRANIGLQNATLLPFQSPKGWNSIQGLPIYKSHAENVSRPLPLFLYLLIAVIRYKGISQLPTLNGLSLCLPTLFDLPTVCGKELPLIDRGYATSFKIFRMTCGHRGLKILGNLGNHEIDGING